RVGGLEAIAQRAKGERGAAAPNEFAPVHGEPPFVFFRMHWDHEPGRISWGAAVVQDPAAALWMFPAWCGWCCAHSRAPMSRFMESRHSLLSMHWDHEVATSGSGAAVPAAVAGVSPAMDSGARRPSGRRDACPTTVRFKER